MRAARAGPVLRGQRFANEQIPRGPTLAGLRGPLKGQCRLVYRDTRVHSWFEVLLYKTAAKKMLTELIEAVLERDTVAARRRCGLVYDSNIRSSFHRSKPSSR